MARSAISKFFYRVVIVDCLLHAIISPTISVTFWFCRVWLKLLSDNLHISVLATN
jgi:hypothetical protein